MTAADKSRLDTLTDAYIRSLSGGTTPAQNHALYVAYGATESQTAFTAADATAAGRSADNTSDTSETEVTSAALTSGQNRHYAIYMPNDRRLDTLHINRETVFNYAIGFTLVTNPATVTIGGAAYAVYVSDNPVNYGGQVFDITTRSA